MQSFSPFQKFARIISKGSINYITCKQKQKRCVGGGGLHRLTQNIEYSSSIPTYIFKYYICPGSSTSYIL